ncbi:conserved hypothetical protein [Burkholderia pseudomallei 576]|nr:conserved hypothetical protein [Burkholderia pseudomallei 576]
MIGELANWRTGELANWRTGELANWRTGELANWRTGELAPRAKKRARGAQRAHSAPSQYPGRA